MGPEAYMASAKEDQGDPESEVAASDEKDVSQATPQMRVESRELDV